MEYTLELITSVLDETQLKKYQNKKQIPPK